MKKIFASLGATAIFLTVTPVAQAAEYYLKIEGIDGESSAAIDIQSWDWAASKAEPASSNDKIISPRDAASGLPTGKRTHTPMVNAADSRSLAPVPSRATRSAGSGLATGKRTHKPVTMAPSDDGDDMASGDAAAMQKGLASAASQAEIHDFSLTLPAMAAAKAGLCPAGKHLAGASIVTRSDGAEIPLKEIIVKSCTRIAGSTKTEDGTASAIYSKIILTGSMVQAGNGHVTVLK